LIYMKGSGITDAHLIRHSERSVGICHIRLPRHFVPRNDRGGQLSDCHA
jgi:hypothetical protein